MYRNFGSVFCPRGSHFKWSTRDVGSIFRSWCVFGVDPDVGCPAIRSGLSGTSPGMRFWVEFWPCGSASLTVPTQVGPGFLSFCRVQWLSQAFRRYGGLCATLSLFESVSSGLRNDLGRTSAIYSWVLTGSSYAPRGETAKTLFGSAP